MVNEKQLRAAFKAAKTDVSNLRQGTTDWVTYLQGEVRDIRERVVKMERRVRELETASILEE